MHRRELTIVCQLGLLALLSGSSLACETEESCEAYACPAQAVLEGKALSCGSVLHEELSAGEVWTVADSPRRVERGLVLEGKLTLEPCAVVELTETGGLQIGSASAKGDLAASSRATPSWGCASAWPWAGLRPGWLWSCSTWPPNSCGRRCPGAWHAIRGALASDDSAGGALLG